MQAQADVLILAGDIVALRPREIVWTRARLTDFYMHVAKEVVYIPGNHELYGTTIAQGGEELIELESCVPGLHTLWPGRTVTIQGQRFLGGPMFQPKSIEYISPLDEINDHRYIRDFKRGASRHFKEFEAFLKAELRSTDIVVSHHAPSNKSLAEQYRGDPANRFYITPEMEPLILDRQPLLWVHGHTHTPFDYFIDKTRVICNPLGYEDEGVRFNPKLVIDI